MIVYVIIKNIDKLEIEVEIGKMNIYQFWKDVLKQDAHAIREYFEKEAYIKWHCTNEQFTVDEFIIANCGYAGN